MEIVLAMYFSVQRSTCLQPEALKGRSIPCPYMALCHVCYPWHSVEALLVHDCVCRDRHRSCYLFERKITAMLEYLSVLVHILES